ncbi:hypothetical protein TNCV_4205901 [Trichonephila clavipes]|nr:hypothetical protein TNCV_4205901 [Trichonephila clavipes]
MASNSKRKRSVLNIETKLEIFNRLAKVESGKSTISDIKKSRETILNFASKPDPISGPLLCEKALELNEKLFGFIYCMERFRLSERCTVPIDSDKRRSTAGVSNPNDLVVFFGKTL